MTTPAKSEWRKKQEALSRKGFWGLCLKFVLLCAAVNIGVVVFELLTGEGGSLNAAAESTPLTTNATVPSKPSVAILSSEFRGDEAYLLTRLLESCYEQWPADISDANAFFAATQSLRSEARRLKTRAEDEDHKAIAERYGDFLKLLDDYVSFLDRLGVIQANVVHKAAEQKRDAAKHAIGGVVADLGAGAAASLDSAAVSVAMAGLTYAFDAWQSNGARDAKLVSEIGREVRQMTDRFRTNLEKARATAVGVGAARNWGRGEIGWDLDATDPTATIAPRDYRTLARELGRMSTLRPRDPFIRLRKNAALALVQPYNASELQKLAEDSSDAAKLIPDVDTYTDYRTYCVHTATALAIVARHAELVAGASIRKATPTSTRALELAELALRLQPSDSTGMLRLMVAAAHLGEGRTEDARAEAENLRHLMNEDTVYQGILASIYAQSQQWDNALTALRSAVRDGAQTVQEYYKDAYLQPLRKARSEEFKKIVAPQWSWDIAYGFFDDDVRLRNDSLFPLTNVKLALQLEQDGKKWEPTLEAPIIQPGETFTWENAISIPSSRLSKGEAILSCDQNTDAGI